MIQTLPAPQKITPKNTPPAHNIKVEEIAKGVLAVITTPGFFSSPEFYQGAEVVFGTLSGIGAAGVVIYYFAGKPDCSGLSGILFVTSAMSAHLAGQAALGKSLQQKLEKMEELNNQQATQIAHYQTLFKQFKKDIEDFKDYNESNQEELSKVIQKFQQQLQSSNTLLDKLFKDEKSLTDLLKAIQEIKDPESLMRRLEELNVVTKKLQDSQKELASTEGRLYEVAANLRKTEENLRKATEEQKKEHKEILNEHRQVLSAHREIQQSISALA
jgi:predicted  nucleic acid-binding Zn-ribbon protein